jgi:hypothetical protein
MPENHNIPSELHAELEFLALQKAITRIRFIEENEVSLSEFGNRFPAIVDELNKATYHLCRLNDPSTAKPLFLNN